MTYVDEFLGSIGVDDDTITKIMQYLDEYAEALHSGRLRQVPESAFGGSPAGSELGSNATLAHQHVAQAITELVAGIKGFSDNLHQAKVDRIQTDEGVGAVLQSLDKTNACTTGTDFSATPQTTTCDVSSLPGGQG